MMYGKGGLEMDVEMVGKTSGRLVVSGFLGFPAFCVNVYAFGQRFVSVKKML